MHGGEYEDKYFLMGQIIPDHLRSFVMNSTDWHYSESLKYSYLMMSNVTY